MSLWDVHVPDHDERALGAVFDFIADTRPDCVVIGGDFLELESMSQHGGVARPAMLREDVQEGRRVLRALREAAGDAEMHYLEGNHETRLQRTVLAKVPTLHGFNSLAEALGLLDLGIGWSGYGKTWQPELPSGVKGKLHYVHGKWTTKYHAAKHVDVYGVSIRYGHTHKPQTYTRGYADGRVCIGIGSPCLRTLDPEWAGETSGWLHGFGVDEFLPDGTFTHQNIVMTNRRFAFGGKVYG